MCKRTCQQRCTKKCTRNIFITSIGSHRFGFGFSPYWDVKSQSLYMTDYTAGVEDPIYFRYDYAEKHLYSAAVEGGLYNPSFFLPMAGCKNKFAASSDKRVVVLHWDGVTPNATLVCNMTAIEQDPIYASDHFDSGRVDPKGRLIAGTYRQSLCVRNSDVNGTLYLFKKDGKIVPLIHNTDTIGGLAWDKAKNVFYFFDSCKYTIYEYKWCPRSGRIRKKQAEDFENRTLRQKSTFNRFLYFYQIQEIHV